MATINPKFGKNLKKYGGFNFNACYNCGNCTAICSISTKDSSFPREMVRYSVLGVEDEITSTKPRNVTIAVRYSTHCLRMPIRGR